MPTMLSCCTTKAEKCVYLVTCVSSQEISQQNLPDQATKRMRVLHKTTSWSNIAPRILCFSAFINPRRACAVRVTILGLCVCVCVCVCVSVCLRLFSHYRQRSGIRAIPTAPVQQALEKQTSDFAKTMAFEIE